MERKVKSEINVPQVLSVWGSFGPVAPPIHFDGRRARLKKAGGSRCGVQGGYLTRLPVDLHRPILTPFRKKWFRSICRAAQFEVRRGVSKVLEALPDGPHVQLRYYREAALELEGSLAMPSGRLHRRLLGYACLTLPPSGCFCSKLISLHSRLPGRLFREML